WIEKEVKPHYPNITPIKLENYRIPLPDNSIDFIIMLNVFHELDDVMETLNECKRVMKPKGKFILSDWRKEETPKGPSYDIRVDVDIATEQIEKTEMTIIEEIPNDLPNNYLIIAEK
ncbi:MAG: class I SAM-dependent methyltransferase, partial [Bacteroidales bacterium]|nr:class I SAM-dependent methyltransferase [Bacteroidales bacterium]